MAAVTHGIDNAGQLDFVTGWYFKAADYMRGTQVVTAFVSTNSICQGEQAGTLWNPLFQKYGIKIHFAHRTFPWESEARGKAHVHVIIIGFAPFDVPRKTLTDYEDPERPASIHPTNISPYLVEGSDRALTNRSKPLCDVPEICIGNKPIDGGHYLFTPEEKNEFLQLEPQAAPYFKRWFGSEEFINGIERWCLWLGDCPPDQLRKMPLAMERVEKVRQTRLASKSTPTNKLAATPTRFHVENMPEGSFLVIPEVSSERRNYIPIGFLTSEDGLCSNLVKMMPNASLFHFAILSSGMHMAWMRQVAGRLKSDYRYSSKLVYNNYPWPRGVTEAQRATVENARARRSGRPRTFPHVHPGRPLRPRHHAPAPRESPQQPRPRRRTLLPQRALPQRPRPRRIPLPTIRNPNRPPRHHPQNQAGNQGKPETRAPSGMQMTIATHSHQKCWN